MELETILAIGMFLTAIAALLSGFPVAFTLGGVALVFAIIGAWLGVFDIRVLGAFPSRIQGAMENQVLIAVPLFILMGVILERSRVAEDLLTIAGRLLAGVRGGLGFAVIGVGALLAASTGIVGATVITMSLIALPTMLQQGYDPKLATGTIAASGTLGQIIPPSIVLILLADAISTANAAASQISGAGPSAVSVGQLFSGALIPGLLLVGLYMAWMAYNAIFRPERCPPAAIDPDSTPLSAWQIITGLGAPILLILIVLGSILSGITPPTEAAAIGVAGALLLAGLRLGDRSRRSSSALIIAGLVSILALLALRNLFDLRVNRLAIPALDVAAIAAAGIATLIFLSSLAAALIVLRRAGHLGSAFRSGTHITSMVFVILIGASLFSLVFNGFYGDEMVQHVLARVPGGKWGALAAAMLVMFVLGFFLDFIEIVFIVVPLVAPPLIVAGFDPVHLAILMALNLQTSFLTPPFGFALFYLRGSAPAEVQTADIWRGAVPFIGLQIAMILLVLAIPALATWLPGLTETALQR